MPDADIIQFRSGRRFRETRVYRQQNNQWVRIRPVTDGACAKRLRQIHRRKLRT